MDKLSERAPFGDLSLLAIMVLGMMVPALGSSRGNKSKEKNNDFGTSLLLASSFAGLIYGAEGEKK